MRGRISFTVAVGVVLLAFAAPANATHVACGDTLTTDTVLDSDIVCTEAAEFGLILAADDITLWFNGHSITGSPRLSDTGVASSGSRNNVTIRGLGTIEGFTNGVAMIGDNLSVRRTNISTTECGTAGGDFRSGITILGDGAYAYRNVVDVPTTCGAVGANGITLGPQEGVGAYAWGNTVRGGSANGFLIYVIGDASRAVLNTLEGIGDCSVGIGVYGYETQAVGSINTVSGCNIGIHGDPGNSGAVSNGRFRRNVVTGTTRAGIYVNDQSAVVGANTANQNSEAGIEIVSAGTRVLNNTANDNGTYGISAPVGVIDGGGNTATGNGVQDCVNVSCP